MTRRHSWDDLRVFLAVANTGSLSAAGRRLKLSHATVGRHIQSLESHLGARLFVRSPEGYALTVAGERLLAETEPMSAAAERAFSLASDTAGGARGLVRLAAAHSLGAYWLIPYLNEFAERYPGVDLELVSETAPLSVKRRQADAVMRLYAPGQENLVGRRIARGGVGFYASKSYLDRFGMPGSKSDWSGHRIVDFAGELEPMDLTALLRHVAQKADVALRCSQVPDQILAVRAGLGISTLMCLVADSYPELVRIAPEKLYNTTDIWLLAHPDLKDTPPVRAVLDFITEKAAADRQVLAGWAAD